MSPFLGSDSNDTCDATSVTVVDDGGYLSNVGNVEEDAWSEYGEVEEEQGVATECDTDWR